MERNPIAIPRTAATRESALATNRVLRNTYLLLGATLAFSVTNLVEIESEVRQREERRRTPVES